MREPSRRILEVCVDSVESALAAKAGGADRLELCANLVIGGTTPGLSLLRAVKRETSLPVHALLRPRFGDFLYTGHEWSLMLEDAAALLEAGADAIVSGALTPEGELDQARLKQLIDLAHGSGKKFTLHRAFDVCRDPAAALKQCEQLGVDTILTSGQAGNCLEGLSVLKTLFQAQESVELLIGAGVNAAAIGKLRRELPGAASFHMSGKTVLESGMRYRRQGVNMGLPSMSEFELWRTDEKQIRLAREELDREL